MKRLFVLLLLTLVSLLPVSTAHAAALRTDTPILWVHGVQSDSACPSVDSPAQAKPFVTVIQSHGYSGPVVPIDYYCGDSKGVSIRGAGGPSTATYPQNGYTPDTPIERLGLDLAWYIYNTYTANGRPVSIAAASMGGLVSMYAITHAGTPSFPPALLIQGVVTFSTPFGGVDKPTFGSPAQYVSLICGGSKVQCNEMLPGSAFLKELASRPVPSTIDITTEGGGPTDILTFASSSATKANHKVNYYNFLPAAYDHTGYLTDQSTAQDMSVELTEAGKAPAKLSNMPHSLEWAWRAVSLPTW